MFFLFGLLIALNIRFCASWLVDSISGIIVHANNTSSLSFIFSKNVSSFNTSIEIEGALIGLDSLIIGVDFGSTNSSIVAGTETVSSYVAEGSINEGLTSGFVTEVMFMCTTLALLPSVELAAFLPSFPVSAVSLPIG